MPIDWENTFDGPDGQPVTVANSSTYGDAVAQVVGDVTYSQTRSAAGSSSFHIPHDPLLMGIGINVAVSGSAAWAIRMYVYVPDDGGVATVFIPGAGTDNINGLILRPVLGTFTVGGSDIDQFANDLVNRWVRWEAVRPGDGRLDPITHRLWWNDPHSNGVPDHEVSTNASAGWRFGSYQISAQTDDGPVWGDEVAHNLSGDWIGPAQVLQEESGPADISIGISSFAAGYRRGLNPGEGIISLRTEADGHATMLGTLRPMLRLRTDISGTPGLAAATGAPVRDMWIGPVGHLRRYRRQGEWTRTPDLGAQTHTSLRGRVVASRSLWSPRTVSLTWDRLDTPDADHLVETVMTPPVSDVSVQVIDPDARNLLTPEQSRGRPARAIGFAGASGVEELYAAEGGGAVSTATSSGYPRAVLVGGVAGSRVIWLHPYWGTRGWPVMPEWPVYLRVDSGAVGTVPLVSSARLWLTFHDLAGNAVGAAAGLVGSGRAEVDVPPGAVTVQPSMMLTEAPAQIMGIGPAWLSYRPIPDGDPVPLGNGCPVYSPASIEDTPHLPWRSIALELQEVSSLAYR